MSRPEEPIEGFDSIGIMIQKSSTGKYSARVSCLAAGVEVYSSALTSERHLTWAMRAAIDEIESIQTGITRRTYIFDEVEGHSLKVDQR